ENHEVNVLEHKQVLVIGLGASGLAACELLRARGARVTAVDGADTPALRREAEKLQHLDIRIQLGAKSALAGHFDLAVVSPGVPCDSDLVRPLRERKIRLIGELELAYQHSLCLNVVITGTNGKTTTNEV